MVIVYKQDLFAVLDAYKKVADLSALQLGRGGGQVGEQRRGAVRARGQAVQRAQRRPRVRGRQPRVRARPTARAHAAQQQRAGRSVARPQPRQRALRYALRVDTGLVLGRTYDTERTFYITQNVLY